MNKRFRAGLAAALFVALSACAVPSNVAGLPGVNLGLRATSNQVVMAMGEEKDFVTLLRGPDDSIPAMQMTWTSSNETVARVEGPTGLVKAVGKGTAIITATAVTNPNLRVVMEVSVVEKHTVSTIRIEPAKPYLIVGEKKAFTAQVNMADGQINGNVTWSSSDDTIATVNPTTGEVSAIKEGKVTILASFTLEPRYKGAAEVTIVKDKSMIPASPSPSPIIFGPASPSPSPTPTPTPTASPTTGGSDEVIEEDEDEDDSTTQQPSGSSWSLSKFSQISWDFGGWGVRFRYVDSKTVFAANGTTLYRSTNNGASWSTIANIGSQNIQAMSWTDANHGWVGGDNGTILKVDFVDGKVTYRVQDSKTSSTISSLFFKNANEGFACASGQIIMTSDGGETWNLGAKFYGDGYFSHDGQGSLIYHNTYYGTVHRYEDGAFQPITVENFEKFSKVASGKGVVALREGESYNVGSWLITTDWVSFQNLGSTLRTPTQILRNATVTWLSPIDASTYVAYCSSSSSGSSGTGWMITRDGGLTWTDPVDLGLDPDSFWAYSENKIWAIDGNALYRSGI